VKKTVKKTVLIIAGGTGGHVFPALAVAQALKEQGVNVEWLGIRSGIEAEKVPAAGITLHTMTIAGLRGKGIGALLKAPWQILRAIWQAWRLIKQLKPSCVLGMGGFVAGPGGVAAWLARCPLLIHEQNAVMGTTNCLLAPLAKTVLLGYPQSANHSSKKKWRKKSDYVGNPVRPTIAAIPAPEQRLAGRTKTLRLLVLGGTLGAKPINDVVLAALECLSADLLPDIWHQTGAMHCDNVHQAYATRTIDARVDAFIVDIAAAYTWADLVLCRAGALTIAELSTAGVASILVPMPHAIDDHQTANARWLECSGGAKLLPQTQLHAKSLASLIEHFTTDRTALLTIAKAARAVAKNNATERVVDYCLRY
jgi:UDP-N-acetylglucosamine--N-acetylmuramyl-(pentapeptide) pyrophosphoryl-undecaprenol N-acetylglucosamine transferase